MNNNIPDINIEVIDQDCTLSFEEVSRSFEIPEEQLIAMINEGIITPQGTTYQEWRFYSADIRRIRITLHLDQDLEINLAGAALALDLLEEIDNLRAKIQFLES